MTSITVGDFNILWVTWSLLFLLTTIWASNVTLPFMVSSEGFCSDVKPLVQRYTRIASAPSDCRPTPPHTATPGHLHQALPARGHPPTAPSGATFTKQIYFFLHPTKCIKWNFFIELFMEPFKEIQRKDYDLMHMGLLFKCDASDVSRTHECSVYNKQKYYVKDCCCCCFLTPREDPF